MPDPPNQRVCIFMLYYIYMKKVLFVLIIVAAGILLFINNKKEVATDEVASNERVMGPQEVVLPYGETKIFSDLSLTFNNMVADYRCPQDAECIEGGAVVANITISANGKDQTLNKPSDEVPLEFEGYKISILETNPPLLSGKEINPKDYVVTFLVEPTASGENI